MATIIRKKKRNKTYYYVATSGRVDGKPRIVRQTYLGTAEHLEQLVRDKATPVPLEASALALGLPRRPSVDSLLLPASTPSNIKGKPVARLPPRRSVRAR